jgi:predicted nucleic acid-binding protein
LSPLRPFLVDTTVLIDISKGREPAASWLNESLDLACVSAVTVTEFFFGLPPTERRGWRTFIDNLTQWDVTTEIAIRAAVLRYDLARQGRALSISDGLIAATAITYGAVLVTANIKDFSETGVPGISLSPRA